MKVTEKVTEEWNKLKVMSAKDRIWYIASYYKFHIGVICIALFLLYSAGGVLYHSTFTTALHIIYINSFSDQAIDLSVVDEDFPAWLGLGKKDLVTAELSYIYYGEQATEYSVANLQKLVALISAKELDVLVCDTENMEHYGESGAFLDLSELLDDELAVRISDRFRTCTNPDGEEYVCAIDISGTDFVTRSGLTQDPPLLGIITNSQHVDNAVSLIRYIFDEGEIQETLTD